MRHTRKSAGGKRRGKRDGRERRRNAIFVDVAASGKRVSVTSRRTKD
jgi:hypothetical protein